ncbi:MAG TPA: hypothetical protein VF498_19050, partial [Anaerolineales bacterium]
MQPTPLNPTDQPFQSNPATSDCASPILFVALLAWVIVVSYVRASALTLLSAFPARDPLLPTVLSALAASLLVGLPALALAVFWKNPRYRYIFRAWALAAGFILILVPVQFASPTAAQTRAVLHILLALVYSGLILLVSRGWGHPAPAPSAARRSQTAAAVLFAGLLALPWLAWGAFGSPLDTVLELAAALSIGLAAGLILTRVLLPGLLGSNSGSAWQSFILGGFACGGVLLLMASGTGFGYFGMQPLLMLELPALGWALMGLAQLSRPSEGQVPPTLSLAALVGLAAAAPMTLIDPDELALIVSATPGEILQWAYLATAAAAVTGLVLGLLMLVFTTLLRPARPEPRPSTGPLPAILTVLVLLAWLAGGLVYFTDGQPGFYGERMFVILKSQADLSRASSISDYAERRRFVYNALVDQANSTQAPLRQSLARLGIHYTPYYLENAIEVPGNPLLRVWLLTQPEVARVLDSPQMRPLYAQPPPMTGSQASAPAQPQWNLTEIGADRVWKELGVTGQGVVVGQSDSGVQG